MIRAHIVYLLPPSLTPKVLYVLGVSNTHTGQLQSGESLFQYPAGQTANDYAHPDHVPVFLQDIVNGADPQVVAACGSDSLCIFDAVQTGNTSIGIATMNTNQDNTVAYQEASE